ncbi:HAD family phosphatase [bacterium]|nr:HAD family phosphatase [bacterium]
MIKSIKHQIASWQKAFKTINVFPTKEEMALLEGMPYKQTIRAVLKKHSKKLSVAEENKIHSIKKEELKKISKIYVYPEIIKLIELLKKRGIKLALVSGANKKFVLNIINKNFKEIFKVVVTGDDVLKGKPNPDPYLKAIKKLGVKKRVIIVIENAPLGIKSSKKAGIKTFALKTTLNKNHLKKADKIFQNHLELLKYLTKIINTN